MQVLIGSIKIPDRIRKDMGDLEPLMESMQRCGQLNPITVTRDLTLIAGHRRCEAATRLGWSMIEATVVDGINDVRRLEIEIEENLHRKDFSPVELLEGVRRLEAMRNPSPMRRLGRSLRKAVSALAFWRYFGSRRKVHAADQSFAAAQAAALEDASETRDEPEDVSVSSGVSAAEAAERESKTGRKSRKERKRGRKSERIDFESQDMLGI